jgi:hypothetical protein
MPVDFFLTIFPVTECVEWYFVWECRCLYGSLASMKLILIFEVDNIASHSETTAEGRPWIWHVCLYGLLLIYAQVAIPADLHSTSDITNTAKGNRTKIDAHFKCVVRPLR